MRLCILIIIVVILAIFMYCHGSRRKESFKILGSLAPQKDMYWQCLSDCERADPSLQLGKTKGSMSCLEFCDSTITDITRRGGPSYPVDLEAASVPIKTRIDHSYNKCGDGTKGNWCRKNFTTDGQIDEKCRQDCAYSSMPEKQCMEVCSNVHDVNKTLGWSFK